MEQQEVCNPIKWWHVPGICKVTAAKLFHCGHVHGHATAETMHSMQVSLLIDQYYNQWQCYVPFELSTEWKFNYLSTCRNWHSSHNSFLIAMSQWYNDMNDNVIYIYNTSIIDIIFTKIILYTLNKEISTYGFIWYSVEPQILKLLWWVEYWNSLHRGCFSSGMLGKNSPSSGTLGAIHSSILTSCSSLWWIMTKVLKYLPM